MNLTEKDSILIEAPVIPPLNTFENIDCMEMLKKCPDKHFDLAIVDPPYGLDIANRDYYGKIENDERWKHRSNDKKYEPKYWDKSKPGKAYFNELFRVSKNQIIWGGNYFWENLYATNGLIIWDKKASGNYSEAEIAWTSFDKPIKIVRHLWNGFRKEEPEERIHPTQKPVGLYRKILKDGYALPGDLILDTHVGSGSSIIACIEGGFNYYGCEIDKDYYDAARRRIARAFRKYELFENEAV